jgi:hypothetical protein
MKISRSRCAKRDRASIDARGVRGVKGFPLGLEMQEAKGNFSFPLRATLCPKGKFFKKIQFKNIV